MNRKNFLKALIAIPAGIYTAINAANELDKASEKIEGLTSDKEGFICLTAYYNFSDNYLMEYDGEKWVKVSEQTDGIHTKTRFKKVPKFRDFDGINDYVEI